MHVKDRYGHSPLFDAISRNHVDVARLLRKAGANLTTDKDYDVANIVAGLKFFVFR